MNIKNAPRGKGSVPSLRPTVSTVPPSPLPPKKKGFWRKLGSALGLVAETAAEIALSGKGGED